MRDPGPDEIDKFRRYMEGQFEESSPTFFGKISGFDPDLDLIIVDFSLIRPAETAVLIFFNTFLMEYDNSKTIVYTEERVVRAETRYARLIRWLGNKIKKPSMIGYGVERKMVESSLQWNKDNLDIFNHMHYLVLLAGHLKIQRICIVEQPGVDFTRLQNLFPYISIEVVPSMKSQQEREHCFHILKNLLQLKYIKLFKAGLLYNLLSQVKLEAGRVRENKEQGSQHELIMLAATLCLALGVDQHQEMHYIGNRPRR